MEILSAAGFAAIGLVVVVAGNLIADAIERAADKRRKAKQ